MSTFDHDTASGRHPVNISHLVMGIAFLGLVSVWAAIESGAVTGGDIRWLLPLPWILAGVTGLGAAFLAGRRKPALDPLYGDHPFADPDPFKEIR